LTLFPFVPKEQTHIIALGNSDLLLELESDSLSDMRALYKLDGSECIVLFFGLLAPSKGLEDLIDAFALARTSCEAKLVIAGYPTKHINMDELRARIEKLGIQDSVIIDSRYIPLNQIRPLMELSTIAVYPYVSSTQSASLQVAYTFGKPVIVTKVGGIPEAVDDGKSGFLVPVHSPRDLADKIVTMINNPKLATEMGAYARHLSDTRFDWRTIAKQMIPVYEDLLVGSNTTADDNG
jgi:glycosyltransferase involved in cell wall biosynthesis